MLQCSIPQECDKCQHRQEEARLEEEETCTAAAQLVKNSVQLIHI